MRTSISNYTNKTESWKSILLFIGSMSVVSIIYHKFIETDEDRRRIYKEMEDNYTKKYNKKYNKKRNR